VLSTAASVVSVPAAEPVSSFTEVESQRWITALGSPGADRDAACARLHALLLRAARFELRRRGARVDVDDLAMQAADDALVAILAKLHTFRGQSRFTTWAYKFALLEAGVKARRRAWQGREVPMPDEGWAVLAHGGHGPGADAETAELLGAVRDAIDAVTLQDVPIDVLAERLGTTRGALYKTLHDARRKLRIELERQGLHPDGGDR
jgi:RNA polymerase sigma-70 factor (ECF subfamily)